MRALLLLVLVGACSSTTENEGGAATGGSAGSGAGGAGGASGASGSGGASGGASGGGGSAGADASSGGFAAVGAMGGQAGSPADASSTDATPGCGLPGKCEDNIKTCTVQWTACTLQQECQCAVSCVFACQGTPSACLDDCTKDANVAQKAAVQALLSCLNGC